MGRLRMEMRMGWPAGEGALPHSEAARCAGAPTWDPPLRLVREQEAAYGEAGDREGHGQGARQEGDAPEAETDQPDGEMATLPLDTLPDVARFEAMEVPEDPFRVPDLMEELESGTVTVAVHMYALKHLMLRWVAQVDRLGAWKLGGHKDCAAWLHFRAGVKRGAAGEWVRTARALARMPLTSAAMSRGEISYSKVRCLTRAVDDIARSEDPQAEAKLLAFAEKATTHQLEVRVRQWRALERHGEEEVERRRHESRSLWIVPNDDGGYEIRGTLPAEVGVLFMRALDAGTDVLFREGRDWAPEGELRGPATREIKPEQRRADALGLLAERALAAGFGVREVDEGEGFEEEADLEGGARPGLDADLEDAAEIQGDAELEGDGKAAGEDCDAATAPALPAPCSCNSTPLSGTHAERYQVMIHVDAETLAGGAPGRCHLDDGTPVSAETVRRLACDASILTAVHGADGELLTVGRKTRTIPPALRRALDARDGGCRWPGCGLRFTHGHHVKHWALGGETKLSNLVSLCRFHHRCVHEDGFRVEALSSGRFRFYDRAGWPLPDFAPPPPPLSPDWLARTLGRNRERGIGQNGAQRGVPDLSATWRRDDDIPWDEEVRAKDVIDPK
jgi:hypothetical protein